MINTEHTPHIGRKIERIRELKGIKQETLAIELGISQQAVSKMEQSESIDDDRLERVAKAIGVTKQAIRNFSEEAQINNNVYDQNNTVINYQFNPIEKIVELYERLLTSEREKNKILENKIIK